MEFDNNEYKSNMRSNDGQQKVDTMSETEREIELVKRKRKFENKLQDIMAQAVDFRIKYGAEDFRYQMMLTYLDVGIEMQDAIELLTSVQTALQCVTEAIGFMDGFMETFDVYQDSMLAQNYGFFERIKRKRKLKQVIRNNSNRMKSLMDSIIGMTQMSRDMTNSMRYSFEGMRAANEKDRQRNLKKQKNNTTASAPAAPSRAETMIEEYIKKQNIKEEKPAGGSSSSQSSGSGSGSTAGWDDLD